MSVEREKKLTKIHGGTLARLCNLPNNTFFDITDLNLLASAVYGQDVVIGGSTIKVTASIKGVARILIDRIEKFG